MKDDGTVINEHDGNTSSNREEEIIELPVVCFRSYWELKMSLDNNIINDAPRGFEKMNY